ncbi:MAG: response regulator [Phycisphaeraceae bacterium]|nr:response regulator [Phycisphaerae bacterium]MBX3392685.1 response regulator [Phycisphaeraceae bacterium]
MENTDPNLPMILAAADALPHGMAVVRQDGVIVWANAACARLLGARTPASLAGASFQGFFSLSQNKDLSDRILDAHAGKASYALRGSSQTCPSLDVRIAPVAATPSEQRVVLVCESAQARPVEVELRHAQKLEVVGQLAGGIAHDFNNLITAIFGYLEIAQRTLDQGHPAHAAIEGVREAAEQAAGVTRSLLTFTRKSSPERVRVNLKELLQQSVKLLRRALPSSIQLVAPQDPAAEPVWIHADANQIQQVILNLALNARDALANGGTIRLTAEYTPDTDSPGRSRAALAVSDTGGGISPEILPRIFDAFFTTKGGSGHSGLGLAIIQDIIKAHDGRIELKTTVGEGTTFRVHFPSAESADAAAIEPEESVPTSRGETLLVVEDDALVRRIIVSQLRQYGYNVIEAGAARTAESIALQEREAIALVICDLELPDRPGDALVARLRAAGVRVPVILITGSIQFEPGTIESSGVTLLRKPFGVARLADTVSKVLSSPGEGHPISTGSTRR